MVDGLLSWGCTPGFNDADGDARYAYVTDIQAGCGGVTMNFWSYLDRSVALPIGHYVVTFTPKVAGGPNAFGMGTSQSGLVVNGVVVERGNCMVSGGGSCSIGPMAENAAFDVVTGDPTAFSIAAIAERCGSTTATWEDFIVRRAVMPEPLGTVSP